MNKHKFIGIVIGMIVTLALVIGGVALANPRFFVDMSQTATATTTLSYMTPGTGTTTLVHDSHLVDQSNASRGRNTTALDSLTLLVQLTATTGLPTLNIEIEDSRDGIDYYRRTPSLIASTTDIFTVSNIHKIRAVFASSTASEGATGISATESIMNLSFEIQPRLRFVRALFYLSSTTVVSTKEDDGAVWAEFIGTKENHE